MTLKELFQRVANKLRESSEITVPELEAQWIIECILGLAANRFLPNSQDSVDQAKLKTVEEATYKRLQGIPLAYVLGEKEFFGLNFAVNPDVLIPRPETEHLVEIAIKKFSSWPDDKIIRVLDLGSGSGCLGLTLLKKLAGAELCAVDISEKALAVTEMNSKSLGVYERVNLLPMDAAELRSKNLPKKFLGQVDLILANPPYIDEKDPEVDSWVRKYEPHLALFSGENGLGHIRRWLEILPMILASKGLAVFEIGQLQAKKVCDLVAQLGVEFQGQVHKDLSSKDRVISIERK